MQIVCIINYKRFTTRPAGFYLPKVYKKRVNSQGSLVLEFKFQIEYLNANMRLYDRFNNSSRAMVLQ